MTPSHIETLERKSLIYKSRLGFYCINHVQGCRHGCRYPCHGYLLAERHGRVQNYADWCNPRIVSNAIRLLDHELTHKRVLPSIVHLSLSTDPFMMAAPEVTAMTLEIIERLNHANISVVVLTKGLLPLELANRRRFIGRNTYGISLVSLDENFRRNCEPGAAPYAARITALRRLHELGCRTRVHMEPYPTPNLIEQDLTALLETVSFVDSLFFGRWNYNSRVSNYPYADAFYVQQMELARMWCRKFAIECEF
jgi:DNA repair photolyase